MDTGAVIELLWEKVLSRIGDKALSPGAAPGHLRQREVSLSGPLPEQRPPPGMAPPRGVYRFGDNPGGLHSAAFSRGRAGEWVMRLSYRDGEDSEIGVFFDRPARGFDVFVKDIQRHRQPYVAYGSWEGDHFRLTAFYTETPYVVTYKLAFCGKELKLNFDINLSLSLQNFGCTGRREREM